MHADVLTGMVRAMLTDTQENLWWGAIIGGFVIVLAVAALLTILVMEVRTIERRVVTVKERLKQEVDAALAAEQREPHQRRPGRNNEEIAEHGVPVSLREEAVEAGTEIGRGQAGQHPQNDEGNPSRPFPIRRHGSNPITPSSP